MCRGHVRYRLLYLYLSVGRLDQYLEQVQIGDENGVVELFELALVVVGVDVRGRGGC